jgi:hypothetical protein
MNLACRYWRQCPHVEQTSLNFKTAFKAAHLDLHLYTTSSMGAVAWYPELQTLRNRILVWNLQTRKMRGCRVGSRYLSRAILAAGLPATYFRSLTCERCGRAAG